MKYYSEEDMKDLRLAMEKTLLSWPDVSTKMMFGSPCFLANGRLFVILMTGSIVLTRLDRNDNRDVLSRKYRGTPFVEGKKIIRKWIRIPAVNEADLDELLPFVKKSYEAALQEGK